MNLLAVQIILQSGASRVRLALGSSGGVRAWLAGEERAGGCGLGRVGAGGQTRLWDCEARGYRLGRAHDETKTKAHAIGL